MSCVKSEGSQCRETPCIMVQREQRAGVRSGPAFVWKSEVLTVPYSCTSKASTRRRQCRAAKTQKSIRALLHTKHKLMIGWEAFLGFVTLSAFVCKLRPSLASTPAAVQRPPAYRRCELIQLHTHGGAGLGSCITITPWVELLSLALGCTDMTVVSPLWEAG